MLAFIEIQLNLFIFITLISISFSLGLFLKRMQLNKFKKTIEHLENEMLHNHAEILRLQKEITVKPLNQPQAPIFSINNPPLLENGKIDITLPIRKIKP